MLVNLLTMCDVYNTNLERLSESRVCMQAKTILGIANSTAIQPHSQTCAIFGYVQETGDLPSRN